MLFYDEQELKETNETYKLQMYRALAWTLGTFVTLFTTLTIAMLAADGSHEQSWQWKWEWTQVVSWEVCLDESPNMIRIMYGQCSVTLVELLPLHRGIDTVTLSSSMTLTAVALQLQAQ